MAVAAGIPTSAARRTTARGSPRIPATTAMNGPASAHCSAANDALDSTFPAAIVPAGNVEAARSHTDFSPSMPISPHAQADVKYIVSTVLTTRNASRRPSCLSSSSRPSSGGRERNVSNATTTRKMVCTASAFGLPRRYRTSARSTGFTVCPPRIRAAALTPAGRHPPASIVRQAMTAAAGGAPAPPP